MGATLDFSIATKDLQLLSLALLRHSGAIGNTIFFVCSAWFFVQSGSFKLKKWFFMLAEIWVISILILIPCYFLMEKTIPLKTIVKCLLPSYFANNWYLSCYLLFYPFHPFLNKIIFSLNQRSLLRLSGVMFLLYSCFETVLGGHFFSSSLVLWVAFYFVIAYVQLYLTSFTESRKQNLFLLGFGILGVLGLPLATNLLGLRFSLFANKLLHWGVNSNPFFFAIALSSLNLLRTATFKSPFVNYLSSLSLLIYIIHENLLLRSYVRPDLIAFVRERFGDSHLVLWVLCLSVLVFLFGFVTSALYERTLRKYVKSASERILAWLCRIYRPVEEWLLKLK